MRESPPAVRHVPAVEPPRIVRDHEAGRAKSVRLEHRERMLSQATVCIVKGDRELVRRWYPLAPRARDHFGQCESLPPRARQPLDLSRKSARRDARDAQLTPALHLVPGEYRRERRPRYITP